jgi:uncharacterized Tic20 family protein
MVLHLSLLAGYTVVPIVGLVAPILIWQIKKAEIPELDAHGRNVVNWIISSFIYWLVCAALTFIFIGVPLAIALYVAGIVFPIIGGIKANSGVVWKYPLTISII